MPEEHRTPVTYSKDEVRQIREALSDESKPLSCPRCGNPLEIGNPVAGGGTVPPVWEVRCLRCPRSLFVAELPASRRPKPSR